LGKRKILEINHIVKIEQAKGQSIGVLIKYLGGNTTKNGEIGRPSEENMKRC
jgi:hypothetical protein